MSKADNKMGLSWTYGGEATRNLWPWADNSQRHCLATHEDRMSRNTTIG